MGKGPQEWATWCADSTVQSGGVETPRFRAWGGGRKGTLSPVSLTLLNEAENRDTVSPRFPPSTVK